MTGESKIEGQDINKGRVQELADELEGHVQKGDVLLERIIELLRGGNIDQAKHVIKNQSDKFLGYKSDIRLDIIEKLYEGQDSPWPHLEQN